MSENEPLTIQEWLSKWETSYLDYCKEMNFADTIKNRRSFYKGILSSLNDARKTKRLTDSIALMGAIEHVEALLHTYRKTFWRRNVQKSR